MKISALSAPHTRTLTHTLPRHVATIMDGNGRWAETRGLPRTAGHKKGAESLRRLMQCCRDTGIPYLTVYAFSSENWKRPQEEVTELMQLLRHYLKHEIASLMENGIRLQFIGDFSQLPEDICELMASAAEQTKQHDNFVLTIALSYGSRQEITQAAKGLVQRFKQGEITPDEIDETLMGNMMYGSSLPDPDLLIRTGGEQRISNFLLWQCAYTEFYFTDTLWPDFGQPDFAAALEAFAGRERRYGNT